MICTKDFVFTQRICLRRPKEHNRCSPKPMSWRSSMEVLDRPWLGQSTGLAQLGNHLPHLQGILCISSRKFLTFCWIYFSNTCYLSNISSNQKVVVRKLCISNIKKILLGYMYINNILRAREEPKGGGGGGEEWEVTPNDILVEFRINLREIAYQSSWEVTFSVFLFKWILLSQSSIKKGKKEQRKNKERKVKPDAAWGSFSEARSLLGLYERESPLFSKCSIVHKAAQLKE